jgi:L-lactate dehydrogenase (cytochrome)
MLTWEEVAKHNSIESCWVVIRDKAYDVTDFLNAHPGGLRSLLRYAGKDGTEEYELVHALGTIEKTLAPGTNAIHLILPSNKSRTTSRAS